MNQRPAIQYSRPGSKPSAATSTYSPATSRVENSASSTEAETVRMPLVLWMTPKLWLGMAAAFSAVRTRSTARSLTADRLILASRSLNQPWACRSGAQPRAPAGRGRAASADAFSAACAGSGAASPLMYSATAMLAYCSPQSCRARLSCSVSPRARVSSAAISSTSRKLRALGPGVRRAARSPCRKSMPYPSSSDSLRPIMNQNSWSAIFISKS